MAFRVAVVIVFVTLAATAIAKVPAQLDELDPFDPRPSRRPPTRWMCQGPSTWAELEKCFARNEPKTRLARSPTTHTRLVNINGTTPQRLYVQALDTRKWQVLQQVKDESEIVSERIVTYENRPLLRVELRTQSREGAVDVLLFKSAFVCGIAGSGCDLRVYACTYLAHGRAINTFLGELVISHDGLQVVGDRSQVGQRCNR